MTTLHPNSAEVPQQFDAWRSLADALSDYVIFFDDTLRVRFVNRRVARAMRRDVHTFDGQSVPQLGLPESLSLSLAPRLQQVLDEDRRQRIEYPLGREGRLVQTRLVPAVLANGQRGVMCITRNVSERRSLTDQLQKQALLDPLTGLANRRGFEHQLTSMIRGAHDEQVHHALCYLDLDDFKRVNDSCGHSAGDELLRQLPTVIRPLVRAHDMIARLGGDEFGVLLHHCELADAQVIAETLRDTIRGFRFAWQTRTFSVGASIGVVGIGPNSEGFEAVLLEADNACYAAKESGRNSVHVSYPHDLAIIRQRGELRWSNRLRKALALEDGFVLHFQSIFANKSAGELVAPRIHEILLRLRDDTGRPILPGAFLPAAERSGLMVQIDRWVIERALQDIGHMSVLDTRGHRFGINLSALSLADPSILDTIRTSLKTSKVNPKSIYFELRENAVNLNLGAALEFMRELRLLGCGLALDDFGSGISSFSYLKNLPVDMIKIDGSLIAELLSSPADEAIVRAVNDIAHHLGISTVAEAVESQAMLGLLSEIGVDYAQGYVLSQPRALDELSLPRS